MREHSRARIAFTYLFLSIVGVGFIYPLIWLFFSSFKPNQEIFESIGLIPSTFVGDAYSKGWNGLGKVNFGDFFLNTFILVIPTVLMTAISSMAVGYGFARFQFPLKSFLFSILLATLMLPEAVVIIPRYILFRELGWLNTYMPFYVPAILAVNAFFVFLLVQFIRGLPRDLDEAAIVDGCNSFQILVKIIVPLAVPALVSVCIFQFIWRWNDFFEALIFINSVTKYPISLGLRMTLDAEGAVNWNSVMAMTVLSILPCIAVFFAAQRYFVEGIATTGIKG
ncbi:carbohydrate ABC transporter permease [Paenibacillus sp. HB172176]|uniref:carbohydrate ABC transporter permease n=1 Tax=Paenibacillus sp. HB172176 TaxID=2493690 RepID=UPI00143BF00C|nr:carbohydrate ABC transporter permease [Paenibacillus sp. HB172176]